MDKTYKWDTLNRVLSKHFNPKLLTMILSKLSKIAPDQRTKGNDAEYSLKQLSDALLMSNWSPAKITDIMSDLSKEVGDEPKTKTESMREDLDFINNI